MSCFFLLVHAYTYKCTYLCTRKKRLYHIDIILSLYLIDILKKHTYIIYILETNCFFRVTICIEADVSALWSARKKRQELLELALRKGFATIWEIGWRLRGVVTATPLKTCQQKHETNAVEMNFPWKLEGCVAVSACS